MQAKNKRATRVSARKEYGLISRKRSQVTIFVILAIVIVALLVFFFIPSVHEFIAPTSVGDMMPKSCIENAVKGPLNQTLLHGGKTNPQLYARYDNIRLNYLCYTNSWYQTCDMQTPFLLQEIENQVSANASRAIVQCIEDMESSLRSKGYEVTISGSRNPEISLRPKKAVISFNLSMTLEKNGEITPLIPGMFQTELRTNAYELIMVASSIQNYEARFGDAVTETYSAFYPNLVVEKKKYDDGTKIYIVRDINTGERLQFAIRSLSWPLGYYIPAAG